MKRWLCAVLALICFGGCFAFSSCQKTTKVASRYEITAEYMPENETLTGTVKINFENCTDNELSVLKFQLYPNAYREDALFSPVSKTQVGIYKWKIAWYNGGTEQKITRGKAMARW